ncbi:cell wall anchored protein [Apiospora sp. TS-2023a]
MMILLQVAVLLLLPTVWALGVPLASATGLDPINKFCRYVAFSYFGSESVLGRVSNPVAPRPVTYSPDGFALLVRADRVPRNSRWYHQSQVKNGVLYIDGGQASFSDRSQFDNPAAHDDRLNYSGPITLGQNNYVIAVDMTKSWDWKKNISEVAIKKTVAQGTSNYIPIVGSGALFHGPTNDPQVYLYGGVTSTLNTSFVDYQAPTTNQYALWGFNTQSHGWTQYDVSLAAPQRPSWGASAEAPELGMAFYLNGMISNLSSANTASANTPPTILGGMVALDLHKQTAMNISTNGLGDGSPRIRGGMVYIPQIGQKGVCDFADRQAVSMNQVGIFDVATIGTSNASNGWVSQTITGDAPLPRVDFCVVSVAAPDNSSYNIFLYGGWDPTKTAYYDDIWVLSLPSFTWTKIYQGVLPRLGHDCHVVGGRQMITVGGINSTDITGICDWEWMGVAILDLSTNAWGSVYDSQKPPYEVTPEISAVVGGGPRGGATKLLPSGGWTSFQIANLFTGTSNQSAPYSIPGANSGSTPSSDKSGGDSSSTNAGAIAGGTVGGVVFVAIVATALYYWRRRRLVRQRQPTLELAARDAAKPVSSHFSTAVPPSIADPQYKPQSPLTPTSELGGTGVVNELLGEQFLAELPEHSAPPWPGRGHSYDEAGDYHQRVSYGGMRTP